MLDEKFTAAHQFDHRRFERLADANARRRVSKILLVMEDSLFQCLRCLLPASARFLRRAMFDSLDPLVRESIITLRSVRSLFHSDENEKPKCQKPRGVAKCHIVFLTIG